ncbi:LysR substrate-binding domain-containing protein [Aquidulcibacter paucihalophilus]|uniref:LysR substrate-binding domain-containing protein n=1 Tax=Aquidulcibacter paucihalophilus TaxID=1978549 RepID=UPI000A1971CF|nr:LysR substrate-binding domain-containing protein [Aquidulcibacter paucihalophilus]
MSQWQGLDEFVAIATAGSFSGGAKLLGTSTTRISRVIVQLEARLQAQLFDRTTRSVKLTDTGRAILEQCRRVLAERDDILASVTAQGEPRGDLRVTCSTTMGERYVAPILRRFAMQHPGLSIELDLTNRVVDLVGEGYDLAIRTGQMPDSGLIRTRVGSRALLTCVAPAYLNDAPALDTIEHLKSHACLLGSASNWHFKDSHGQAVEFKPSGRWRCNNGNGVLEAAMAGMGVCQLPEFYVLPALRSGALIEVLTDFRPAEEPIWAVYPQRRHLLPKVRGAVSLLKRELAAAIAQP